jgi:hypothetical protein
MVNMVTLLSEAIHVVLEEKKKSYRLVAVPYTSNTL